MILIIERTTAYRAHMGSYLPSFGAYTHRPRVVHGREDRDNLYPYVVSLESENTLIPNILVHRLCSGSLIAKQWVLTAAHCLHSIMTIVRYGDVTTPRNKTSQISKVLKRIIHPSYLVRNSRTYSVIIRNDIGLVFVEPILVERLGIIHMGDYKTFVGRACVFAGFGFTHADPRKVKAQDMLEDLKKPLQVGEGSVRGKSEEFMIVSPSLAVVPKCGKNQPWPNSGDSGGPLIIDRKVVGVCSAGTSANERRFNYNFYTPLSPYTDWIRETMAKNT